MTSRYTDTSRFEEADWDLLVDAAPSILSAAMTRGAEPAVLFVESSRHSIFTVRQAMERQHLRVPRLSHQTRYLEGASVETATDNSSQMAVASEPSPGALLSAVGSIGSRSHAGGRQVKELQVCVGLDSMNRAWPDVIALEIVTELLRRVTESCFSLNSTVCRADAELTEVVRRVLVFTSDSFAGWKQKRTISCKLECVSDEGLTGTAIRGTADQGVEAATDLFTDISIEAVRRFEDVATSTSPAPGNHPVILQGGWCAGVWLHEAIGHHFESDNVRRGWSSFRVPGEQISDLPMTIVDDPSIPGARGTDTFDDEGTEVSPTVLVDGGVVRTFLHSRQSAAAGGSPPTGNGRRQDYLHRAQPRMTNLVLLGGDTDPAEMISRAAEGVIVTAIGNGVVDASAGTFSFEVLAAHELRSGAMDRPLSGFRIAGESRKALSSIRAIGNDFDVDSGRGTCVKNGQRVPVGLGAPSILIDSLRIIPQGASD